MPGILGQDAAQVSFAYDQHAAGDFGPSCEYESFGISVRAATDPPGRPACQKLVGLVAQRSDRPHELGLDAL
jgi:hypothetical protein